MMLKQLKQLFILLLLSLLALFTTSKTLANPGWEISFQEWDQTGFFDYTLYYPYSSQVISKVSLPQDQLMKIIDVKHRFTKNNNYIRLQYGGSGTGLEGEGSDWDWVIEGFNTLTHYGVMDVFGEQKLAAVEFGTVLIDNEKQTVNLVIGWVRQETTNELKNVVYHLIDGEDVGVQPQPDNGSRLDGESSGLVLGVNQELSLRPSLILITELDVSFLSSKAYGHWANHNPAWNWENTGRTVGYGAEIGLKYIINNNLQAKLGYFYNYAKSTGCRETLNGELLAQLVDLEYERKGLQAGLVLSF